MLKDTLSFRNYLLLKRMYLAPKYVYIHLLQQQLIPDGGSTYICIQRTSDKYRNGSRVAVVSHILNYAAWSQVKNNLCR